MFSLNAAKHSYYSTYTGSYLFRLLLEFIARMATIK